MSYTNFDSNNFTGGLTDNVKINNPALAAKIDNFNLLDDGSIITRPGLNIYSENVYHCPTNTKVNHFFNINDYEFMFSGRDLFSFDKNNIDEVFGGTSNKAIGFGSFIETPTHKFTDFASFSNSYWKNHQYVTHNYYATPSKVYVDSGVPKVLTAGLPEYNTDAVIAGTTGGGKNYIYGIIFKREYTIDNTTFIDYSPVNYQRIADIESPDTNSVSISTFQTISNGTQFNYGLAGIEVEVYRTENNGQTLYFVDSIPVNTAGTITDSLDDASLIANKRLYTNGDIKERYQPPKAKYVEIVNNTAYYAGLEDNPYRLYYSIPGVPDGVPPSFYLDLEDEITGMSSINRVLIAFTKTKTYKISGAVYADGSGKYVPTVIDGSIGSVNGNSIAQATTGVYFAGNVGFCFTDGYRVKKISDLFNSTFSKIVKDTKRAEQIKGIYDKVNKKMYWTVQAKESSYYTNDTVFVFYERYGVKQDGVFTTWTGQNMSPISLFLDKDNELITTDIYGIIYKYDDNYRSDIVADLAKNVSDWGTNSITYDYISTELNLGNKSVRKWIAKLAVRIRNISDLSMQPKTATDGMQEFKDTGIIDVREQLRWGERYREWETDDKENKWINLRDAHHVRYIHKGGLRAYTKQIRFTNAFIEIEKSDDVVEAEVSLDIITDINYTTDKIKILEEDIVEYASFNGIRCLLTESGLIYKWENDNITAVDIEPNITTISVTATESGFIVIYRKGLVAPFTYRAASSPDLETFTFTNDTNYPIKRVAEKNGSRWFVGDSGVVLSTSVGSPVFTVIATLAGTTNLNNVYISGLIYIIGDDNLFMYSSDGVNFTRADVSTQYPVEIPPLPPIPLSDLHYITVYNGKVYIATLDSIYVSEDLLGWVVINKPGITINSIETYRNIIVCTANDGTNGYYFLSVDSGNTFREEVLLGNNEIYGQYLHGNSIYFYGSNSLSYRGVISSIRDVVLTDLSKRFCKDNENYYISFEDDNYTKDFRIIESISNTHIRISVRDFDLSNGIKKWLIRGYSKKQKINILSYSLYYILFGESFDPFNSNDGDSNE